MKRFLITLILALLGGLICLLAQRCSDRPLHSLEKPLRLLQPDTESHLHFRTSQ